MRIRQDYQRILRVYPSFLRDICEKHFRKFYFIGFDLDVTDYVDIEKNTKLYDEPLKKYISRDPGLKEAFDEFIAKVILVAPQCFDGDLTDEDVLIRGYINYFNLLCRRVEHDLNRYISEDLLRMVPTDVEPVKELRIIR